MWFTWRGSDTFPLLVYDPEQRGVVTGPEQLFGEFSFGKRWANGYDALASLDTNGDHQLTGVELASISVWFDRNRDGVSQEGEVESATAVGLEMVATTHDAKEEGTGFPLRREGYRRKTKNGLVTGRSVDWYGRAYRSREEAVSGVAELEAKPAPLAPPKSSSSIAQPPAKLAASLQGGWIWTVTDPGVSKQEPGAYGLLTFAQKRDRSLVGHSYVEIPMVQKKPEDPRAAIRVSPLAGVITGNVVEFTVQSPHGVTASHAKLSPDGRSLRGTSTYQGGKENITTTYQWVAVRP